MLYPIDLTVDLHSIFLFSDRAREYVPRLQTDDNSQGMAWKLIRVSSPDREAGDARTQGPTDSGVLLALGMREVLTCRGLTKLELIVQTLDGETVCEMSAHDQGFGALKMTNGYLVIEDTSLRGWRIGSYCFNHLVTWARRHYGDRDLFPIKLEVGDAKSRLNRVRRNKFYEQFGIEFDYADMDGICKATGESRPMKIGALIERSPDCFSNIQELDVRESLAVAALLFPQAQRRVSELLRCVSEAMRETRPSRRFLRVFRYFNWLNYALCIGFGAIAMNALSRLS